MIPALGGYLRTFVDVPIWMLALVLLAVCAAFNIWGLRESSWINIPFATVECSPVCTESSILVDLVIELPIVNDDGRTVMLLACAVRLAVPVEVPA